MSLRHGGRLNQAARRYGIEHADWLDLSTGINPEGYSVQALAQACWSRLPESDDGLFEVAAEYYGSDQLLLSPGSQWVIQELPYLRTKSFGSGTVLVPKQGYQEHRFAWEEAGFKVEPYDGLPTSHQIESCAACVVINPNNPTGYEIAYEALLTLYAELQKRQAWLIVDEAFIEASNALSLAPEVGKEGLIVCRSLGKFFGLAGARVGAVLAWSALLQQLDRALGPWPIAGPSRQIAKQALSDHSWQEQAKVSCSRDASRLAQLLYRYSGSETHGTDLFQTLFCNHAPQIYEALCEQAILVRLLDCQTGIRFGLPGHSESNWQRLETALSRLF